MAHPISEHLKKYVAGGKTIGEACKATGIHADRMKSIHDGDGDAPSQEELKALGKYLNIGEEDMKKMSVKEPAPVTASALDGQDVDEVDGDGDDDVEHEDLAGGKPTKLRRDTEAVKLLTVLTGTADPKKQAARVKAMQAKAEQWEDDHNTVVALRAEREAEKRRALIEKGKADGQLTPPMVRYWMSRDVEELEEFLKVAPKTLSTRSLIEADPENVAVQALSREELEVARLCGIDADEMVEAKKLIEATADAQARKQRSAMTKMYKAQDAAQVKGVIALRKESGLRQ